jgi:hypothetical protein
MLKNKAPDHKVSSYVEISIATDAVADVVELVPKNLAQTA